MGIAKSSAPTTSAIPYAAGRPIDGADVVRNPPVRGAPPRRFSFTPTVQNRLLDPGFKVRDHPKAYFVPGKVFLTLWTEPASAASAATSNKDVFAVAYGEHAFCRVRRFVVVRSGLQSCSALAVSTHSGRGSPQGNKNEHGIIYTGRSAPDTRNEPGLQSKAIKVNPDDKGGVLDPQSRLNYGKVYNVEHNVKVKNFGSLSPEYLNALLEQFTAVFTSRIRMAAVPAPASLDRDDRPDMTGNGPKDKQQFLGAGHRDAVARHAAAGGRATGANTQANTTTARGQQPGRETIESSDDNDDDDDEEDDDNENDAKEVAEESSDDDDDEDDGDDDEDDDEEDDDDDEQR